MKILVQAKHMYNNSLVSAFFHAQHVSFTTDAILFSIQTIPQTYPCLRTKMTEDKERQFIIYNQVTYLPK